MKIDIMTLFPEMVNAVMGESMIGRAQEKGLVEIRAVNIRDYATDKHHKADDAPYGGGRGQVMLAEPLYLCHQALCAGDQGKRLVQIGAELPDVSRASRIISRGKNAAGRSACAGFEADDVVALPAVHGNRDLRQSFQCGVGIDSKFRILFFCEPVTLIDCLCFHFCLPDDSFDTVCFLVFLS